MRGKKDAERRTRARSALARRARQLFCDANFCNYLDVAKTAAKTVPTLMYIAEHWADVAEPFCHEQFPETPTYVMGGHLMAYEYPEKFNARLEEFLAGEGK